MSSSHFNTSFSSAAAGKDTGTNNHPPSSAAASSGGGGGVGANSADWTRRANGSSTSSTTRRPSLSTTLTHPSNPLATTSSNVYHPPHHYNRQSTSTSTTYGKEELLNIFRAQESGGHLSKKISDLLDGEFSSTGGSGGWGRSGDEINGVDLCWEKEGGLKPMAFEDLTEEERELFSGSVNSPHKVPNNNQGTPNHHVATPPPNRNKVGGPISATPGSARPGTGRRREASDAAAGGNPFSGTPTQLQRRRTDLRDGEDAGSPTGRTFFGRWGSAAGTGDEENKEKEDPAGTGGRNTGLFRRGSAAWGSSSNTAVGSTSALNSPMGTFGNNTFGGGGAMGGFTLQPSDKQKKGSSSVSRPGIENVDERAEEEEGQRAALPDAVQELRQNDDRERPTSSDTDPFGIGGDRDDHNQQHDQRTQNNSNNAFDHQQRVKTSSPFGGISISTSNMNPRGNSAISTPTKTRSDLGFTPFGGSRDGPGNNMMNMGMSGLQHQLQNLQFNNQGQVPLRRSREGSLGGALAGDNEPLSPAETNPFMSPPPEKADEHEMMNDLNEGGGLGSVIAGLRRGEASGSAAVGSDRSGRSSTAGLGSVGGALGGGGFGGLGSAGLWSSTAQMGTPGGSGVTAGPGSFFGGTSLAELASPGGPGGGSLLSGGLGGVGPLGGQGFGSASRASRLGQLFPENQHQDDQGFESDAFGPDPRYNAFGSRRGLGGAMESPMRERGDVNDLFGFPNSRSFSNLSGAAASQDNTIYQRSSQDPLGLQSSHEAQHGSPLGQQNAQATAAGVVRPPPGAIPPVMVMPDKINWVYRDPSGTIQGPFSGLEMHEWYRAGFFTQDLAVKRAEDTEFEQLGLLVRRIGNTREPFLVPLPGNTSAGMSTNATSANWSETWLNEIQGAPQAQAQTPGSMQPPFAGSFPTFGTTLTAEQQNALERRKQEEQYLMAKQREFLLQQQMMAKQATMAQQLHHQSSTQSLHSQPSFGSLHSPSGFPPTSAPAAPVVGGQNAFEPGVLLRQAGAAAGGNDPLNIGGQVSGMQLPGGQFPPQAHQQQEQVLQMQQQQQRLAEQQRQQQLQRNYQTQQTQHVEKQLQDAQEQQAQQVHIQQLQQHHDAEQQQVEAEQQQQNAEFEAAQAAEETAAASTAAKAAEQPKVTIPKAAPAPIKTSPPAKPVESPWGATPMVQPFPPPPSQESPTQAAAASPAAETPSASIAPWAKEAEQAVKTPSLKEIQEIEAKQAAVREAAEAQARREMLAQQALQAPPPPAPGLPSTATWATSPSSTPSAGGASAWNKPLAKANSSSSSSRKTLQQIQKEEEARKAKNQANVASQAAVANTQPLASSVGKRYADLASKTAAGGDKGAFPPGSSAWTTVGPGGKSKGAAGASPAPPTPAVPVVKTMGSGIGLISAVASAPKKPTTPVPSAKPITSSAQDEFLKWCRGSMKGLNSGVTPEQVIDTVSTFPSDAEIIADTIYTVSSTMDGRRWAEEYIKRREAAGSGVVIDAGTGTSGGAGGWNEVAKRPQAQQPASGVPETNNAFRVVAGKKKGARRG